MGISEESKVTMNEHQEPTREERALLRRIRRYQTTKKTYRRPWPKVKRNDPCPCGSGVKFKKCCGVYGDV